jgi:hypothetical protein
MGMSSFRILPLCKKSDSMFWFSGSTSKVLNSAVNCGKIVLVTIGCLSDSCGGSIYATTKVCCAPSIEVDIAQPAFNPCIRTRSSSGSSYHSPNAPYVATDSGTSLLLLTGKSARSCKASMMVNLFTYLLFSNNKFVLLIGKPQN